MKKRILTINAIILLAIFLGIISSYFYITNNKRNINLTTFNECQSAGNTILETYPPQCITPNGKSFTQNIGNELEKSDLIVIDNPRPNQQITLPITIQGKARGNWYFEGSFPVRLVSESGFQIATGNAKATDDWMTEKFVAFELTLNAAIPEDKNAILILEKANPSGLQENSDQLMLPVTF